MPPENMQIKRNLGMAGGPGLDRRAPVKAVEFAQEVLVGTSLECKMINLHVCASATSHEITRLTFGSAGVQAVLKMHLEPEVMVWVCRCLGAWCRAFI